VADLRAEARRIAAKYRLDPGIFERQIEAESNFDPNARSPAGAQGIAQFMPGTARAYGVNVNDPISSLDGAARYLRDNLKKTGGSYAEALSIYNSGRPDGYLHIPETRNYVQKILGGKNPKSAAPAPNSPAPAAVAQPAGPVDTSAALQQYLAVRGRPGALLGLAQSLATDKATAPTASAGAAGAATSHLAGVQNALAWATQKIGNKETGPNSGGLASYANKRFGMSNAPWCAMFTSLAVTKGGAPASARTASVAQVLQKAQAGQGYVKGFVPPSQARPGDLVAFGTSHIGMIKSVDGRGRVTMIAGNDSNQVQERPVALGHGTTIVRPAYGHRR
jgi:hypothetical protein